MEILDILLDILLKPPQPFIGLFFDTFTKDSSTLITDVLHQESVHRCILGWSA